MLKPREERHSVLIRARMRAGGPATDVCVRNVSGRGMLLLAHEVPAPGTYVEILLPDDVVVGRVMWAGDRRFGIRSRDKVPLHKLLGVQAREAAAIAGATVPRRSSQTVVPMRTDSRLVGRSLEFIFLVAGLCAVAIFAAIVTFETLTSVSDNIATHL
jgi:hypothetical protein